MKDCLYFVIVGIVSQNNETLEIHTTLVTVVINSPPKIGMRTPMSYMI